MARSPIDYHVLDAISFDAEQFDDIVAYLNAPDSEWRAAHERVLQRAEVLAALMRLVRDGAVLVKLVEAEANDPVECRVGEWPNKPLAEMVFDLTGRGTVLYLNWES